MRGGALRKRIAIQRRVQVGTTGLNEPNFVWQTWRRPFAEVTVLRGREHFDPTTKQRYAEDVWHFRVRYSEAVGFDPTMRILYEDKQFDVRSSRPDEQFKRDCIIECTTQDPTIQKRAVSIAITMAIPAGKHGVAYGGFTVSAKAGQEPYAFAIIAGALPTGLLLNAATGAVSGTPTAAGSFDVTIKVTDAAGKTAELPSFNIQVTA